MVAECENYETVFLARDLNAHGGDVKISEMFGSLMMAAWNEIGELMMQTAYRTR